MLEAVGVALSGLDVMDATHLNEVILTRLKGTKGQRIVIGSDVGDNRWGNEK